MKIYNQLMRFGLGKFKREVVRGQGQSLLKTLFLSFDDVDWQRTVAYSLGNVGQIRLNVRGREPQGIVSPGEQYETVRDEIIRGLSKLRDPDTGELVVQAIYRREEIYHGRHTDLAADIVFIPTRMEYFGFGEYEFGSNEIIESMKRGISGTHRPNGMFLLWGPPVLPDTWVKGANLVDLAPTILHLMDQPVLSDMDGRVLTDTLKPEFTTLKPRVEPNENGKSSPSDKSSDGDLTADEAETISKRLRDLGYVG